MLTGDAMPVPEFTLDVSDWAGQLASGRRFNAVAKNAARETMEFHLKENIPRHFKREARSKYRYTPRTPSYVRYKQRRYKTGGLDLVKTGASREQIPKSAKVRVGGTAENNDLVATIKTRFRFADTKKERIQRRERFRFYRRLGVERPRTHQGISILQMVSEVQVITPDELRELRDVFSKSMSRQIEQIASGAKRKRRVIKP
jgi:hypothetical protein